MLEKRIMRRKIERLHCASLHKRGIMKSIVGKIWRTSWNEKSRSYQGDLKTVLESLVPWYRWSASHQSLLGVLETSFNLLCKQQRIDFITFKHRIQSVIKSFLWLKHVENYSLYRSSYNYLKIVFPTRRWQNDMFNSDWFTSETIALRSSI